MVREVAIAIYLFVFWVLFNVCKLYPLKNKTVGVATFGDNIHYTTRSLQDISNQDIIILKTNRCTYPFSGYEGHIIPFDVKHPIAYLKSIYHLATATTILVDNYYGFLAVTNFKEETTCIQLWHASGAIKSFGLTDPTTKYRSKKAKERFLKVYEKFHYTVVSSEKMANVFRENFRLTNDRILRTGVPRTDIFYQKTDQKMIQQLLNNELPNLRSKKVILYAPTFRENELANYQLKLNLDQLHRELAEEYVLLIRVHPAVTYRLDSTYQDFVYDVSDYYDVNHLLLITDLLITDYSSIPFEYAILQKPMIFYAYDMEEYRLNSGLIADYEKQMPGPIVRDTNEIIQVIKNKTFHHQSIQTFANEWNEYSTGNASMNVAKFIIGEEQPSAKQIVS